MKKKICFIAQFPPPIHGLSKAVDTLYNSELQKEFEFEKIDITDNKRIIKNIIAILRSKADLYYFTISQSERGNIRDLIILKLLEKQHKKCLIHLHGGYYRKLVDNDMPTWQKTANYNAIKKVAGVIVLGESLKYIFENMIDEQKIFIVPNCVDNEFLLNEKNFDKKIENIDNKNIKDVLYLSNFIKEKGYEYVLELAKLEKQNFNRTGKKRFHFHFAGKFFNKNNEEEFFKYINKNDLKDFVTYYGIVDGDKKRKLLKRTDIFILLTKYKMEGQPISILEAMANGMIVITTNHAGIPDVVKDRTNGIIENTEKIDVEMLYKKMCSLKFKPILLNNYNIVQKKYMQNNYIQNMQKIFKKLSI